MKALVIGCICAVTGCMPVAAPQVMPRWDESPQAEYRLTPIMTKDLRRWSRLPLSQNIEDRRW